MTNAKFTSRLNDAVDLLRDDPSLRATPASSRSLFSPVYRNGKYIWVKLMDSDGLLLSYRKVHNGEGAKLKTETQMLVGVVIQSEDETSQTKPNPLGKASIAHIPNGVWVAVGKIQRLRIDKVLVVFVLPKGAAPKRQKKFRTAKQNVLNASDVMPDAIAVEVSRGASAASIATALASEVRPFLVGRGRPRHGA